MYKSYYGLSFNPFDKHSLQAKDCFNSADHKEMISRLNYLKDVRGVGVFTAEAGMGKSYALRCFAETLNWNLFQMEYICLSTVSVMEFYRQFCACIGVETGGGKIAMFQRIQERTYYMYKDKRKPLIIAIDEAQYLRSEVLKDIKMLLNQQYDSLNCFSLILCGEPVLNNILERQIHEALKQRIAVHYDFSGLSDDEVAAYILHKLTLAGSGKHVIDEAAISAVHSHSRGNPRLIDNVMTDALLLGTQMDKKVLDADVIRAAINSQIL